MVNRPVFGQSELIDFLSKFNSEEYKKIFDKYHIQNLDIGDFLTGLYPMGFTCTSAFSNTSKKVYFEIPSPNNEREMNFQKTVPQIFKIKIKDNDTILFEKTLSFETCSLEELRSIIKPYI